MENNIFQNIDDSNNTFNKIEDSSNNTFNIIEDSSNNYTDTTEAFVMGLPDWDLEPLYETVKRSEY